jgi:hypothetical protein
MPLRPSGLRVWHVAIAGIVLALLVPLLMLFALVKLDPRVRSALQIEREAKLPVLGSMPMYMSGKKRSQLLRRDAFATILFLSVPVIYGLTYTLKLMDVL